MPDVTITLAENEALVLFDLLTRFTESGLLGIADQAEQRALWNLNSVLERQLVPNFDPEYQTLLNAARDAIRDEGGTDAASESKLGRLAFWLEPAAIAFIVDEWRKLPREMPDEDRKRWADISFRAMSALHKAGIDYVVKKPLKGYYLGDPRDDTGGTVSFSS